VATGRSPSRVLTRRISSVDQPGRATRREPTKTSGGTPEAALRTDGVSRHVSGPAASQLWRHLWRRSRDPAEPCENNGNVRRFGCGACNQRYLPLWRWRRDAWSDAIYHNTTASCLSLSLADRGEQHGVYNATHDAVANESQHFVSLHLPIPRAA